jgi:hypothetical protein
LSWILTTILMLAIGFACIWGLCEWLVARRRRAGRDDGPSRTG